MANRSASISAATLDLRKAASVYNLEAASSACSLDLRRAFSVAILSVAISAYILDLRKALSAAISASILDLLNATSAATRDAASSASILDLLRAFSVSKATRVLKFDDYLPVVRIIIGHFWMNLLIKFINQSTTCKRNQSLYYCHKFNILFYP